MKLAFLVYHPRSGSTMLGNLLHGYEDIYVSYELDFIDGIARGKRFSNDQWSWIKNNPKSKAWSLPYDNLKSTQYKDFRECLSDIASNYISSGVFLFKNGKYRFYLKKLINVFPESKIVFVTRDPRSVYLSQSGSKSSITSKAMIQSDPILFAKQFLLTETMVSKAQKSGNVLRISYEDLIQEKDYTIKRILSYLNVSDKKEDKSYSEGISDNQKHLHSNVDKGLMKSRLTPWKTTDRAAEIQIIQKICKQYLEENQYELSEEKENNMIPFYIKYWLGGGALKWFWYILKSKYSINRDHFKIK